MTNPLSRSSELPFRNDMNRGANYSFLVKNPKAKVSYTASASDGSVLSVSLTNAKDIRGWLFTITGLKTGTAIVNVLGSDQTAAALPVTVTGTNNALTLDTLNYTLPPQNSYEIGSNLTGIEAQKLTVYSSSSNVATVTKLKNGNYRVTGVKPGVTYIMYDVYGKSGKKIAHASVKIIVQLGVQAHGISRRQTVLF